MQGAVDEYEAGETPEAIVARDAGRLECSPASSTSSTARRAPCTDGQAVVEAEVRVANDGNETVPTVGVAGRVHANPDPTWLRAQLAR